VKKRFFFALVAIMLISLLLSSCSGLIKSIIEKWYTLPEMVSVSAGNFTMGDTLDSPGRYDNEIPLHQVTLTYDYLIGKYEVTNKQFLEFLNDASITSTGYLNNKKIISIEAATCEIQFQNNLFCLKQIEKFNYQVSHVTWDGAVEYCNWLNEKEGLEKTFTATGDLINYPLNKGYRLPTEAEWEYAARGAENDYNTPTDYMYAGSNDINSVACFFSNSENTTFPIVNSRGTNPVGSKNGNEIGLYDMNGNVWEFCCDWIAYYSDIPQINPVNNTVLFNRVMRGGGFYNNANDCRLFRRSGINPEESSSFWGFRLAKSK